MQNVIIRPPWVSLRAAVPRESVSNPRYYWDGRWRGKNRFCIFQYSWSGAGVYNAGGREAAIPQGHALFTTNVEPSAYYYPPLAREPWVFGWMELGGAEEIWAWLRKEHGSVVELKSSGPAIALFRELAGHYVEDSFQDRFHSSELVFRFLMEVLRELTLPSHQKDSAIYYARHYIDDHHRRPLVVKELANKVGMSREHFSRSFSATLGQSPGAYLRERRLQTAELLLRQSSESIRAISRLSGFNSSSHFCRAFRAQRGCSPEGFRKKEVAR